jgi:signal transduction histidine kinase
VVDAAVAMAAVGLPEGAIRRSTEPLPPVRAEEGELVQIALNLLVNAVQASGPEPEIEISAAPGEGGVLLRVRDRGTGIPADVLPRVFDPFFTTKPPGIGTGLGLSISYDLARRNGGRLEAANRPDGGAEFTLWLPVPGARGRSLKS